MENKKNSILRKIDLLIISLETLNIFFNKNLMNLNQITTEIKTSELKLRNTYRFIHTIKNIYNIKLIIKEYLVDEIAVQILADYTRSNICNVINQYNEKFYYICSKDKKYYKNYKLLTNKQQIEINNISLTNLYIISQMTTQHGTYILIKYLLQ